MWKMHIYIFLGHIQIFYKDMQNMQIHSYSHDIPIIQIYILHKIYKTKTNVYIFTEREW
jgi:uncharacterized membrane protein SirB2